MRQEDSRPTWLSQYSHEEKEIRKKKGGGGNLRPVLARVDELSPWHPSQGTGKEKETTGQSKLGDGKREREGGQHRPVIFRRIHRTAPY